MAGGGVTLAAGFIVARWRDDNAALGSCYLCCNAHLRAYLLELALAL